MSTLLGTIHTTSDTWLIDSGASRHMLGYKENLSEVVEKDSHLRVVLGDDANYTVKGSGATSLQLESNDTLHLSDVLYVPGMKRNLVSISALEDKGYKENLLEVVKKDSHLRVVLGDNANCTVKGIWGYLPSARV